MDAVPLAIAILASSLTFSQATPKSDQKPSDQVCAASPDDDEIYSVAIQATVLKEDKDNERVVLWGQTAAPFYFGTEVGKEVKELMDSSDAETEHDYETSANRHCALPRNIKPQDRIVFVTRERYVFPNGIPDWKAFYKRYLHAGGFTLLSGIGFNKVHNQALIYIGNYCGNLSGRGYVELLAKKDDKWEVVKAVNCWDLSREE
jgi:hypothetical protein